MSTTRLLVLGVVRWYGSDRELAEGDALYHDLAATQLLTAAPDGGERWPPPARRPRRLLGPTASHPARDRSGRRGPR